jgi:resuscitation-promoting factor RpfB
MRRVSLRGVAIIFSAFLVLVFALIPFKPTRADNERVITVYYDGNEQTVVTDAATVGEVLNRAKIDVANNDLIEPGLKTQLSAPTYNVNIYRARPVTVIDGRQRSTVITAQTSAPKIAEDAGISLYDEDIAEMSRIDDFLAEDGVGLKLTIARATPLTMVLYGKEQTVRTQAKTVADLLKEKQIELGAQDSTNVPQETVVSEGMHLEIYRNGVQTVTAEEEVAFDTEVIRDTDKPVGFREVQRTGTKGKKLVTYEINMVNGQEQSRKVIQTVVTQQPAKQVEVVGVQLGFSESFKDALARLRMCEAGGHYDRNSGNGYYGAYQYDIGTWGGYMGYARADLAPPEVQDQKVYETYLRRGWKPWPTCSVKLGLQDVYR